MYPYSFGMMAQGGQEISQALESWNQLILGWLPEENVYCVTKDNLKNVTIPISPIGAAKPGIESVMIKLSENQVLVFELNKKEAWTNGLRRDFNGIFAYLVDTKKDTNADCINSSEFGTTFGTSNYLPMPGLQHVPYNSDGISVQGTYASIVDSVYYHLGNFPWNQNLALFPGEKTVLMGLNVEHLLGSNGDFLKISIS